MTLAASLLAPSPVVVNAAFPPKMQVLFQPFCARRQGYWTREEALAAGVDARDVQQARYKVLYGGRGGAKSWSAARASLVIGMGGGPAGQLKMGDGRSHDGLRVLCVREIQDSLRDSVKKTLADQMQLLSLGDHYEVLDDIIRGRKGTTAQGTEFAFEGLRRNHNKVKSHEGDDLVLAEEAEPISEASWRVLTPTIRTKPPHGPLKMGPEFWIMYNPELESGDTHQRFVVSPPENAIVQKVTWRDNPYFPMEMLRADMEADKRRSLDLYNHIWEGECLVNLDGAVYADELREAQEQGRICEVEPLRHLPVSVYFDIGRSDYTVMWFVQQVSWDYRLIDFYKANRKHIDHYLEVLQRRGYVYDTLWLPHDAAAKTIGSKMSVEEQVKAKGYKDRCRLVPKLSVLDGINAARTIFPNCYFDRARTAEGVKGLREYVYDIDPTTKQLGKTPEHSDIGDAFRYFAVASQMGRKTEFRLKLPEPGERVGVLGRLRGLSLRGGGNATSTGWLK
jgi:phage terminase large subunit